MKYLEKYGLLIGVFSSYILVMCAGFINSCISYVVDYIYVISVVNLWSISSIALLAVIKNALTPAIIEESMRHVACRKGVYAMVSFPIIISLLEHYWSYAGEPITHLFTRLGIHGMLTAIQFVGFGEKKPLLFLVIAMVFHFLNNFNAILS